MSSADPISYGLRYDLNFLFQLVLHDPRFKPLAILGICFKSEDGHRFRQAGSRRERMDAPVCSDVDEDVIRLKELIYEPTQRELVSLASHLTIKQMGGPEIVDHE